MEGPCRIPWEFGTVVRARCGSYACRACGRRKVARLRRRLTESLVAHFTGAQRVMGDRWRRVGKLLTLTCDHKAFETPEQAAEAMAAGWNRLRTLLVKRYGPMPFFRVWESHQDGYPHLHIVMLTPRFIPWAWLAWMWEQYGIGQNLDIRNKSQRVDNARGLARYLCKYLAKGLSLRSLPFTRRWGCSRGFLLPESRVKWWNLAWYDQRRNLEQAEEILRAKGANVRWWRGSGDAFDWAMPGASYPLC